MRMTPQERELVDRLFERLVALENERRDPDAERAIMEGLHRAPNAVYALVQSVLVQDEALKRADERIRALEEGRSGAPPAAGFLDSMRDALFGREQGAPPSPTSVPQVRSGAWNNPGPQPAAAAPAPGIGQGGSFLGTAAAAAAGMIGGSLLMNSFRSMFAPHAAFGGFDSGNSSSPWSNASNSDLARQAGLDDIGGGGRGTDRDPTQDSTQVGFLDQNDDRDGDSDGYDDSDFDDSDGDDMSDA
jgi:hypothetical protein